MDFKLTAATKGYLLQEARSYLESLFGINSLNECIPHQSDNLEMKCGAFVTLHDKGGLRGCVGLMESRESIVDTVRRMAKAAAFEDSRFLPLEKEELENIKIEITLLSPMVPATPDDIVVGRDGIYVEYNGRHGVLLPQVAVEQGWDREEFLSGVCIKAGLPKNIWTNGNITLFRFGGLIFNEEKKLTD